MYKSIRSVFILFFIVVQLLAVFLLADESLNVIPENAESKRYGSGWKCIDGYIKQDNVCELIVIPENAYATGNILKMHMQQEIYMMEAGNVTTVIKQLIFYAH